MKGLNFSIIIFLISIVFTLSSCEDKEEFRANVIVINNTETQITDFHLKGEGTSYLKTIEILESSEENKIEINWIGKSSALFGSMDNSFINLKINYTIGTRTFSIQDEKDVKIDSYGNYYSEKTITNNTNIKIIIEQEQYVIIYEE